jgi:hypothetical protein
MNQRCTNPRNKRYADYGGRGIQVCDRWRTSFAAFLEDMGRRPSPEHSIDRYPNNDGNYEPGNCRWATAKQQRANRRVRSHCARGHAFTPDNVYVHAATGRRQCRACHLLRQAARYKKQKQEQEITIR